MNNLRVTLVQTALHWEDPAANRADLEEKLRAHTAPADLVVLPEMFTTGFTMNAAPLAEPMNLTTFKWLRMMAAHLQAVVAGSYLVREGGRYYNRLVWMRPDGTCDTYDKRHLFRMAREHETYTAGTQAVFPMIGGWRFLPLICYDLRFPVWSRQAGAGGRADCLLYVANWPEARRHHWNTLLAARAIENQVYVVGVNRTGTDGNGIGYSGDSTVVGPRGDVLFSAGPTQGLHTAELDGAGLHAYRHQFPAHLDADAFTLHV